MTLLSDALEISRTTKFSLEGLILHDSNGSRLRGKLGQNLFLVSAREILIRGLYMRGHERRDIAQLMQCTLSIVTSVTKKDFELEKRSQQYEKMQEMQQRVGFIGHKADV